MSFGRPPPPSVRGLLRLAGVSAGGAATDRDLIRAFALDRSEAAFAALMARHGAMVRAVCRRSLRDHHLADDAVQATFVVLARRAGAVRWKESLAGWLFEVARRVSRKAAAQAARRATREARAADAPEPAAPQPPPPAADLTALQAALDDELARLPERLRLPVVLCHLEGLSHEAVAKQLGITDGQLRGRLYRAKLKLQDRLTRRGFTLTAVLLALAVAPPASALPPVLAAGTLRLATAADALVPPSVLALTHGVTPAMLTLTTKTLAAVAACAALGLGAGGWAARSAVADDPAAAPSAKGPDAPPAPAAKPARPVPVARRDDQPADPKNGVETVRGTVKAYDAAAVSLLVKPVDENDPERGFPINGPAPVTFAGKPIARTDLKAGMRVELDYRGNSTDLIAVRASWPPQHLAFKAFDPATRSFSIETGGDPGGFEIVLAVAPDAVVTVDGLPAGPADVPLGQKVEVGPSLDKKGIVRIDTAGDPADLPATLVRVDRSPTDTTSPLPFGLLVTLRVESHSGRDDHPVPFRFNPPSPKDMPIRLNGKDATWDDLKPGMRLRLKLSPKRNALVGILAADPLPQPQDDDGKADD